MMKSIPNSAFVGVAKFALLRLDHKVKFYLWKGCNDAMLDPDDLLKTRRLMKTTYAGLLDLTRHEKLEDPPLELPPVEAAVLEYAHHPTLTRPTPEVRRYFKQVVLHAEHRLFGSEPNFRELQLDARFIPTRNWVTSQWSKSTMSRLRQLVRFLPPPHGGEEVLFKVIDWESDWYYTSLVSEAKDVVEKGGLTLYPRGRSLLPLFNFQLQHFESLKAEGLSHCGFETYTYEAIKYPDPWPYAYGNDGWWPVDKEDNRPANVYDLIRSGYVSENEYTDIEDTTDDEYSALCIHEDDKNYQVICFRGVLQIPLHLVTVYMQKQVMAVLGKQGLDIFEFAIMNAIGSRKRRFDYWALKEAFPVLPTVEEARQLVRSPAVLDQLTFRSETMVEMLRNVGRALFAIGVDEVFGGDEMMQDDVEAAAKQDGEAHFIGFTCLDSGDIKIKDDGRIKWILDELLDLRYLPSKPDFEVFDFVMSMISNRELF